MCYVPDGDMCFLVIMCALALIRTGTGAAVTGGDKEVVADNRNPVVIRDACFHECVPRCDELVRMRNTRCCNCISMCEKACVRSLRSESNGLEDRFTSSPLMTRCTCDTPDVVGRRSSVLRRSRRRPPRSPMLREAAIIARSVGMDLGPVDTGADSSDVSDSDSGQVALQLVSLVPGDDALTALVSWDSVSPGIPSGTPWYLVTWETEGGVRGNLLTNSTSASLTLWPETVYHVEVCSTSSRTISACLEIDTHSASTHVAQDASRRPVFWRVEDLGGVAAAAVLFLVVLLVSVMRCRGSSLPSKHCDQSHLSCDRYKLYPPPVTLRHAPLSTSTSTELPTV